MLALFVYARGIEHMHATQYGFHPPIAIWHNLSAVA